LNQPSQVGYAPAIAGKAVERKGVILTMKFLNSPHADHQKSIAISIQAIQAVSPTPFEILLDNIRIIED